MNHADLPLPSISRGVSLSASYMPADGAAGETGLGAAAAAPGWTVAERSAIAGVKARVVEALLAADMRFDRITFPFAIHHRVVVRTVRHGFEGRAHLRSSEVAHMLDAWARSRGGAEIYAWQAVALAADAVAQRCGRALPCEIDEAVDGLLVDRGLGFVRHVRRLVRGGHLP